MIKLGKRTGRSGRVRASPLGPQGRWAQTRPHTHPAPSLLWEAAHLCARPPTCLSRAGCPPRCHQATGASGHLGEIPVHSRQEGAGEAQAQARCPEPRGRGCAGDGARRRAEPIHRETKGPRTLNQQAGGNEQDRESRQKQVHIKQH